MAFDSLTEKLQNIFKNLRSKGRLTEDDVKEALKEIKALDPAATVVMCSAMGQEAMVMDSIKSGAKDFIVKPFKPERILSTIKKILG